MSTCFRGCNIFPHNRGHVPAACDHALLLAPRCKRPFLRRIWLRLVLSLLYEALSRSCFTFVWGGAVLRAVFLQDILIPRSFDRVDHIALRGRCTSGPREVDSRVMNASPISPHSEIHRVRVSFLALLASMVVLCRMRGAYSIFVHATKQCMPVRASKCYKRRRTCCWLAA